MRAEPFQLTVLTTDQCTAECAHCCMRSSPIRRDRLTYDQIQSAIDDLCSRQMLGTIIFAGGEPTLLGETLLDSIAYASSLGINTRLVTNVAWAINETKAHLGVNRLREAGLRELNISYDDYHLPFIPPVNLKLCYHATKGAGFSSVVFAVSFHEQSAVKPEFVNATISAELDIIYRDDGDTPDLVVPDEFGTSYFIHAPSVQALGRFHETQVRTGVRERSLEELMGGCQHAITSAALSPKGTLLSCCGTELTGNEVLDFGAPVDGSFHSRLGEADDNIIVQAIRCKGPAFIANFIRRNAPDIPLRPTYGSVCEVCEHMVTRPEVVRFLMQHQDRLASEMLTRMDGMSSPLVRVVE